MTNKETLERAISLAIEGGWIPDYEIKRVSQSIPGEHDEKRCWVIYKLQNVEPIWEDLYVNAERTIFDHNFARSLWGEEPYTDNKTLRMSLRDGIVTSHKFSTEPAWQYHLQAMVLADDPIEYLSKNI